MKFTTKLLILSVITYLLGIGFTIYWGGLWLILSVFFVLGLIFDIYSYIRLRQGKPLITYHTIKSLIKNSRDINDTLGEKRF